MRKHWTVEVWVIIGRMLRKGLDISFPLPHSLLFLIVAAW
jgi:hypothetical protein